MSVTFYTVTFRATFIILLFAVTSQSSSRCDQFKFILKILTNFVIFFVFLTFLRLYFKYVKFNEKLNAGLTILLMVEFVKLEYHFCYLFFSSVSVFGCNWAYCLIFDLFEISRICVFENRCASVLNFSSGFWSARYTALSMESDPPSQITRSLYQSWLWYGIFEFLDFFWIVFLKDGISHQKPTNVTF